MRIIFVVLLALIATGAQAKSCIKAPPKDASTHWHYRYVDGKKCWHGPGGQVARSHDRPVTTSRPRSISPNVPTKALAQEHPLGKAPVPVEAITERRSEPQAPSSQPSAPEPTRVRTLTIKAPPTARRRIDAVFDAFVKRCENDLNACDGLNR